MEHKNIVATIYLKNGQAVKGMNDFTPVEDVYELARLYNDSGIDKIAIFDEAQRAWKKEKLSNFMRTKKGQPHFDMSEPECLIEYMNRHRDWATIVCLVGGGQEIHDGEAGISEWFNALNTHFPDWKVFCSDLLSHVPNIYP